MVLIIWDCLVLNPIFGDEDRDVAFKWMKDLAEAKLMMPMDENFFDATFGNLDPALLTETGMECMEVFFTLAFALKLTAARQAVGLEVDESTLVIPGLEYLWKVVLYGRNYVSDQ